jgi:hypothetical protein
MSRPVAGRPHAVALAIGVISGGPRPAFARKPIWTNEPRQGELGTCQGGVLFPHIICPPSGEGHQIEV